MMPIKICQNCGVEFRLRQKSQIGKFCSRKCQCKGQKRIADVRRKEININKTEKQHLKDLKKTYEKFVIKNKRGCWDWKGSKSSGYGNFRHQGKIIKAHRASWILYKGKIENNLWILHKCDNRICSNPKHLFIGDVLDNSRDMTSKGRNKSNKLNIEKVLEIRKMMAMKIPLYVIAEKFNVHRSTIDNISQGKTWKDVIIKTVP